MDNEHYFVANVIRSLQNKDSSDTEIHNCISLVMRQLTTDANDNLILQQVAKEFQGFSKIYYDICRIQQIDDLEYQCIIKFFEQPMPEHTIVQAIVFAIINKINNKCTFVNSVIADLYKKYKLNNNLNKLNDNLNKLNDNSIIRIYEMYNSRIPV